MNSLNSNQIVRFTNGKSLPAQASTLLVFLGLISLLIFKYSVGLQNFLAVPFLVAGLVPFFYRWGTEISFEDERIREYTSIFGLESGDWKSFKAYSDIVVQTHHYTGKIGGIMGLNASAYVPEKIVSDQKTNVYFMTYDHRHKLLVAVGKNADDAFRLAKLIAEKTGKEIKKFNPTMTAATRARRFPY